MEPEPEEQEPEQEPEDRWVRCGPLPPAGPTDDRALPF